MVPSKLLSVMIQSAVAHLPLQFIRNLAFWLFQHEDLAKWIVYKATKHPNECDYEAMIAQIYLQNEHITSNSIMTLAKNSNLSWELITLTAVWTNCEYGRVESC